MWNPCVNHIYTFTYRFVMWISHDIYVLNKWLWKLCTFHILRVYFFRIYISPRLKWLTNLNIYIAYKIKRYFIVHTYLNSRARTIENIFMIYLYWTFREQYNSHLQQNWIKQTKLGKITTWMTWSVRNISIWNKNTRMQF